MLKTLFIFGTRPEAIKMAPLIDCLNADDAFEVTVCVTGQHREMLDQVLSFFSITPHVDLNLMKHGQTLFDVTADTIRALQPVLEEKKPDVVIVQGDTTSTMIGALAAFYTRTKVAHLEAGLRSGDKYAPFPEEVNRRMTGHIADYHFAPTERARTSLANEGITDNVWIVGNTVVDALLKGIEIVKQDSDRYRAPFPFLREAARTMLVTGHRRENFGGGFEQITEAIATLAKRFEDLDIVYPVHLNPNVQGPVRERLSAVDNVHLIEPLDYPHLLWLMNHCDLVLTDSGGIQEEAPALGKPVLVMRDVTERVEGIDAGTAKLVGTDAQVIIEAASELLTDEAAYRAMAQAVNPYGDGTTSQQVRDILKKQ